MKGPERIFYASSVPVSHGGAGRNDSMSVVVAVRKGDTIAMAADTQTSFGDVRVPVDNLRARKISPVGGAWLGKTGWGLYDNILAEFLSGRARPALTNDRGIYRFFLQLWRELHDKFGFVNDQCREKDSPFGDLDAAFLVINRGGIHHVASDMSVTAFSKYYAIGAGNDFALGALHALYDDPRLDAATLARRAVETANAFKLYCGGDVDVVTVKAAGNGAAARPRAARARVRRTRARAAARTGRTHHRRQEST
jgi:ATP-dependent HslUV protease subunit HslV